MGRDKLSFKPTIDRPCEESWAAMQGGSRERHCESCDKQVHNFAAMSSREIERLVHEADGKLCARITQRGDGSLVTLDARPRASMAAQVVASASLIVGASGILAQSTNEPKQPEAVLTGTVLKPDGSEPVEGAAISLRASNSVVATAKSDQFGNFRVAAKPGTYDVVIRQNALFGMRVAATTLHDGEQSLQFIKTHFYYVHDDGSSYESGVTMGAMVSQVKYSFTGVIRHP